MGSRCADVRCRHPGLLGSAVEGVAIKGDVGSQHKTVSIVSRDRHLDLSNGHAASARNDVDLLAVGARLQALASPDG